MSESKFKKVVDGKGHEVLILPTKSKSFGVEDAAGTKHQLGAVSQSPCHQILWKSTHFPKKAPFVSLAYNQNFFHLKFLLLLIKDTTKQKKKLFMIDRTFPKGEGLVTSRKLLIISYLLRSKCQQGCKLIPWRKEEKNNSLFTPVKELFMQLS